MPGALGKFYASLGGQVSDPFRNFHADNAPVDTHGASSANIMLQVELMGKPALVIYKEALQLLGFKASEVVAIGDSLV